MEFEQHVYDDRLDMFYKKMGLVFNGNASEKLVEVIAGKIR